MGIGSYFRASKPPQAIPLSPKAIGEATPSSNGPRYLSNGAPGESSGSTTPIRSAAPSIRSTRSSYVDDIKHEVMVNYVFQQQCSHLWVNVVGGENEGVVLRKAKNCYLACPPQLASSPFAIACAELNVQVSQSTNSDPESRIPNIFCRLP